MQRLGTLCFLVALMLNAPMAGAATLLDERGLRPIDRLIDLDSSLERDSTSPTFQTFLAGAFGSGDQIVLSGTVVPGGDTIGVFAAKDGRPLTSDAFGGMGGAFLPNIASAGASDLIEFLFERSAPEPGLLYAALIPLDGTDFGPAPLSFAEAATFTVPVRITLDEVVVIPAPSSLTALLSGIAAILLLSHLSARRQNWAMPGHRG
ncbi:MAG: hypothetical protein AAF675_04745 [Pseudomonadota bacterium]